MRRTPDKAESRRTQDHRLWDALPEGATGNGPFRLEGGPAGCLLIHGLTGTPAEMRYLGERLHRDTGFAVSGVMLAGHGTEASEFRNKGWADWYRSAEQGLLELAETRSPVFVVGFSMGGAIAMALALRHGGTVRALALLATPLFAHRHKARLAAMLYAVPGFRAWLCRRAEDSPWEGATLRKNLDPAQTSFAQLKWILRRKGACIAQPLLILQSRQDPSVPWENALALNNLASSRRKRRVLLTRSHHVLPMDVERDLVADEIRDFFLSL
jgi:carboxylesterase